MIIWFGEQFREGSSNHQLSVLDLSSVAVRRMWRMHMWDEKHTHMVKVYIELYVLAIQS